MPGTEYVPPAAVVPGDIAPTVTETPAAPRPPADTVPAKVPVVTTGGCVPLNRKPSGWESFPVVTDPENMSFVGSPGAAAIPITCQFVSATAPLLAWPTCHEPPPSTLRSTVAYEPPATIVSGPLMCTLYR